MDRDVEHALVISQKDVGGVFLEIGRALHFEAHPRDAQRVNEPDLEPARGLFLGALPKEVGHPLDDLEHEEYQDETDHEGRGHHPGGEAFPHAASVAQAGCRGRGESRAARLGYRGVFSQESWPLISAGGSTRRARCD